MERLLSKAKPNREAMVKFMCDEHGFSEERIGKFADTLIEIKVKSGQKGIGSWTG